jgi:hypothetical protein
MSLLDALLNESYRDPREIYIALRADGQKGSGTIDDPYDGSRRDSPVFAITSLSRGGTGDLTATAVTSSNHPFVPGDMVTITGVATGEANDCYYTGTFAVASVSGNSFTYQMIAKPKSATAPGTISCFREREQFDAVMRTLPANSIVDIGPGVFESKGTTAAIAGGWDPKSGQRIQGSGRGVTTLKLVNASWPERGYGLIGHRDYYAFIEDFEVSDITFDCNIAGQPNQIVEAHAFWLTGRHIRARRLRTINFSSQTTGYVENFVFALSAPHPDAGPGKEGVDNVIEDCIAEQPGLSPLNNSSVFILGGGERPTDGFMSWHRACAIRRCWYDGTFLDRPVPIASITIAGGVATVTTRVKHYRNNGDWVVIAGAVENGSEESTYNGSYPISNVSEDQFTYTPVAYAGLSVPTTNPTGDMWLDRFSSHPVPVEKIELDSSDPPIARLTCRSPHYRKEGLWVRVLPSTSPPPPGAAAYYGRFPIINGGITSPIVLKYQMNGAPTTSSVPAGDWLGVFNAGVSVDGGSEAVAEGNCLFNTAVGGPYHDTWGTRDFIARQNYYSDVFRGPYQNMTLTSALKLGSSLTYQNIGGQWIAMFTTYQPHGLQSGANPDKVKIRGAVAGYSYTNPYTEDPNDAGFTVLSTPTDTSFTYALASDPGMNAGGSPIFFKVGDPNPVKTGSVSSQADPLLGLVAVFDTAPVAHDFEVGALISVFGVTVGGSIDNPYNGVAKILAKTNTTFTYKLQSTPLGSSGGPDNDPSCAPAVATPLVSSNTTATFRTVFPHGFVSGQGVKVQDVDPEATGIFVGNFKAETVPSSTAFTFALSNAPSDNARPGSLFAAIWQVGLHVVEDNIIELNPPSPSDLNYGFVNAIAASASRRPPLYTFRQVVVRNNLIRNLPAATTGYFYGITFDGAENALVEGNVIGLPQTNPIFHNDTKSIRYFNNLEPSGKLIQGTAGFGGPKADELATQIEDALTLCL